MPFLGFFYSLNVKHMVGFAAEGFGSHGASEDLVLMQVAGEYWGPEQEAEAKALQQEHGLLLDQNISMHEAHDKEYPEDSVLALGRRQGSPSERMQERQRLRWLANLKAKREKKPK